MFEIITNSISYATNCNEIEAEKIQKKESAKRNQKSWRNSKLIKYNLLLIFILSISCTLFQSCGNSVKDKGNVTIKNGKNEDVSVPYERTDLEKYTIDKPTFTTIINEISNSTIAKLKYPLSFNPSNITFKICPINDLKYYDTKKSVGEVIVVNSVIYFSSKNGFGNEIDGKNEDSFYIKDGSVDRELPPKLELAPLLLEESSHFTDVNRSFLAYNSELNYIQITPKIQPDKAGIYLIVNSSIEGGFFSRALFFSFLNSEREYDNELVLRTSTGPNYTYYENGTISYHDLSMEQIEILRNNKLKGIRIENYPHHFYCLVDENLQSYFKEYFSIKEVEEVLKTLPI